MAIADQKQLWIDWTHDALVGYQRDEQEEGDEEDIAEEMVSIATKYADFMLEEFEERFSSSGGRPRKKKRKKKIVDDDDDDTED